MVWRNLSFMPNLSLLEFVAKVPARTEPVQTPPPIRPGSEATFLTVFTAIFYYFAQLALVANLVG